MFKLKAKPKLKIELIKTFMSRVRPGEMYVSWELGEDYFSQEKIQERGQVGEKIFIKTYNPHPAPELAESEETYRLIIKRGKEVFSTAELKTERVLGKELKPGDLFVGDVPEPFYYSPSEIIKRGGIGEGVFVRTDIPLPENMGKEEIFKIKLIKDGQPILSEEERSKEYKDEQIKKYR